MNRINPLYIAALLIGILIFTTYKLSLTKIELNEAEETYQKTKMIAVKLNSLQNTYSNKQYIKKSLKHILNQKNINYKFTNSSLKISAKTLNKPTLNKLMSILLNKSYNITNLEIKTLDNENVSFKMEIKW